MPLQPADARARLAEHFTGLPPGTRVTVVVDTRPSANPADDMRLILAQSVSPGEALDAMRDFTGGAATPTGDAWAVEVPGYAQPIVERLETIKAALDRATNMVTVRREAHEREAANLGAALGSILARVLLEQRRGEG